MRGMARAGRDLRSLETVGGRAWIYRDTALVSLRLDALTQVADDVIIQDDLKLLPCVVDDIASHAGPGGYTGFPNSACHCETICGHAQQLCP